MAEGKIKYGGKKFKKMLSELCKEAAELAIDYKCKVGIFLAPPKTSTVYAVGSPSVASVVEEYLATKAKMEKRKRKKVVIRITKKKAKLQKLRGNCAKPN